MAKWIQSIGMKKGALRSQLGIKGNKKIPSKRLNSIIKGLKSKAKGKKKLTGSELTLLKRANLAKTLRGMKK